MTNNLTKTKKKVELYQIVLVGIMAAVVCITNFISIPIGNISRIHFGNIFCIISGFILGPVYGGLAAGIGAGIYDLFNPLYAPLFYITIIFKFAMAYISGLTYIKLNSTKIKLNKTFIKIISSLSGNIVYTLLYISRYIFEQYVFLGNPWETVAITTTTKLVSSLITCVITTICVALLSEPIIKSMQKTNLFNK